MQALVAKVEEGLLLTDAELANLRCGAQLAQQQPQQRGTSKSRLEELPAKVAEGLALTDAEIELLRTVAAPGSGNVEMGGGEANNMSAGDCVGKGDADVADANGPAPEVLETGGEAQAE